MSSRLQINVSISFTLMLLYGIKPGYSVLRKEHNVKVFENAVLREYLPHVRRGGGKALESFITLKCTQFHSLEH